MASPTDSGVVATKLRTFTACDTIPSGCLDSSHTQRSRFTTTACVRAQPSEDGPTAAEFERFKQLLVGSLQADAASLQVGVGAAATTHHAAL
mgnify:FL=1